MTHDVKTHDGTPISRFCFGAMQFGGKADEAASRAMYDDCRAAGVNFFDTAHAYTEGTSETWLGKFAASEREKIYIASKANFGGGSSAANIRKSLDESLQRLGSDYVDLYYLHRWDGTVPLEESFECFAELIAQGRIGAIGVSNFAAWQVVKAQWVASGFGVTIKMLQPMYNLVKRQAEVEILPMCADQRIAAVPYSPLGGGLLTGKYAAGEKGRLNDMPMYEKRYSPEWMHRAAGDLKAIADELGTEAATLAVAWVAKKPAVAAPIISARSSDQLKASLAALDYQMDDALYARLTALTPTPPPATDRLEEAS